MLVSIHWLKDYVTKQDATFEPREIADHLTMRGISVAAIRRPAGGLEQVVVGKIEKIEKHPNADRLQVTQVAVSEGEGATRLQIVCGAKNIAEGDIVPVALPGSILPGNLEIKISSIRGVESRGMICSGKELGISEDSDGILQLPKHSSLGTPLSRLLGGGDEDTILELELTPNRSDCLGMLGVAREVCPFLKTKLRDPKPARFKNTVHRTSSIVKIEVDDPSTCPRYVARVIDGLKVTESPDWIKQRLSAVGIRPINNIVDITNFVMMEYGQPLHAFDLRKLESGGIRVATCKAPAPFSLLSGETVMLQEGDILIQDGDRPIALAGIMGGANSVVDPDTTSIVLESAAFPAEQIRKTAKRLGIVTESAKRFEKGTDLAAVALASERAASLLRDSFNANVYHPPIDTDENAVKEHVLSIDMRDVRKITGIANLSTETVSELLDSIGITSQKRSVNILSVKLPSFRQDLKESIDLIEEVARLVGYEAIPESLPLSRATYDSFTEEVFNLDCRIRNFFCHLGLRETIHYSFFSSNHLQKYGFDGSNTVVLKNPLSDEMRVLRSTLLPSLLETYRYNRNRKVTDQRIFEVARTYRPEASEETTVKESPYVAVLIAGNSLSKHWMGESKPLTFFHVKGLLDSFIKQFTTIQLSYESSHSIRLLHPNRGALLKLGMKDVGFIGEVHPFIRRQELDTDEAVFVFELNLEHLKRYERTVTKYKPPSKFPPVDIDIAVVVESQVPSQALSESIRQLGGGLLSDVSLFDVYEGKNIPEGKKSLAFHLVFLANDRTLQESEVLSLRDRIVQNLTSKHGAQLRT